MNRAVRLLLMLSVAGTLGACLKRGPHELRKARDNLPADSDEYSDCSDVIAAAIKGGSNRGSGAGSKIS